MAKHPVSLDPTQQQLSTIYTSLVSMGQRQGGPYEKYLEPVKNALNTVMGLSAGKVDVKAATILTKVSQSPSMFAGKSLDDKSVEQPQVQADDSHTHKMR